MACREIILRKIAKPEKDSVNNRLIWIASSIGLFTTRDKSGSCFRIFIELLKATKLRRPISSDELAFKLNLSRGTVVYHLNRLMDCGIAKIQNGKYLLNSDKVETLLKNIKDNADFILNNLISNAKEIDKNLP